MNIWVNWNKVKVTCLYCKETIKAGNKTIYMQTWGGRGKFKTRNHAHLSCWLESIEGFLMKNPYIPRSPAGSKKSLLNRGMTVEQRKERFRLINIHSALKSRITSIIDNLHPGISLELDNKAMERVGRLEGKQKELIKKMDKVGGVPKKWAL